MIVFCCIKSIHIGAWTCIVLHKLFEFFKILNLCTVTVHQPCLVFIIESCPWKRYFIFGINFIHFTPISNVTENRSSVSLLNQMFNCLLIFYLNYLHSWLQLYFLAINNVIISFNFLFVKILWICMNGR